MAKVPHGVETLPKILIARVGCTNVTDEMTDRRTMTYSEREHMRPTVGWGVDTPPHTQSHSDRPTFVARHAYPTQNSSRIYAYVCIVLLQLAQQTAKEGIQSDPMRHRLTSLTPADQMNDVMRDARPRDSKRAPVDVTEQTSMQREMAVSM